MMGADSAEQTEQDLEREIVVWRELWGQHVLSLLGTVLLNPTPEKYLPRSTLSDYHSNGDLKKYISLSKPDARAKLELLCGVAAGVSHIHQQGIVHGDLKDVNVLVDDEGRPMICDFGSAYITHCETPPCIAGPPDAFDSIVTQRYLSPEVHLTCATSQESDIWALGCILLEESMLSQAWRSRLNPLSGTNRAWPV
ncbi:unnamed protein product [Rhizoctonia solani]|uniref:Protein kinase domain-containing protein n=1 Tax=Rhizoctonia solani TaxID=456999 RepID=A0A8H3ACE9_9AGAM|nr:unnamed protein product [Rhizoctonia solani]